MNSIQGSEFGQFADWFELTGARMTWKMCLVLYGFYCTRHSQCRLENKCFVSYINQSSVLLSSPVNLLLLLPVYWIKTRTSTTFTPSKQPAIKTHANSCTPKFLLASLQTLHINWIQQFSSYIRMAWRSVTRVQNWTAFLNSSCPTTSLNGELVAKINLASSSVVSFSDSVVFITKLSRRRTLALGSCPDLACCASSLPAHDILTVLVLVQLQVNSSIWRKMHMFQHPTVWL